MTDIHALLARVAELDSAATDGPWEVDPEFVSDNGLRYRSPRVYVEGWSGYPVNDACEIILPATNEDATLSAEYRTAAPAMARALQAVLEVHERKQFEDEPSESYCDNCQRTAGIWPCSTVRAITRALEVEG